MLDQAHLVNTPFINIGFDPATPYNDLPRLPPAPPQGDLETIAVLKSCVQARAALADLNQICLHFPNPSMLWRIAPLVEAQWSCRLDGVETDCAELLKYPLDLSPERLLQEQPGEHNNGVARVLAGRRAIELGYDLVGERPLDVSMLLELASAIEGEPMPVRRGAGIPVKTGASNEISYTPPEGPELIQRQLGNWERFIHIEAGTLDPLVLIAVAHYQLVAIQPFGATAGSLARMNDGLIMAEESLLSMPVLGLSAWLYQNRQEYARLQVGVSQEQRWQEWLLFFLKGITTAAQSSAARLQALRELQRHTEDTIAVLAPKVCTPDIIELIFTDPCVRIQNIVERGIARRQTASIYLKKLCEIGVLEECPYGKEKLFVHSKLIKLLDSESPQFSNYSM